MKNDWQIIAIFVLLFSVSACSIDGLDPLAINGIDGIDGKDGKDGTSVSITTQTVYGTLLIIREEVKKTTVF
jgi:hypothetical protein